MLQDWLPKIIQGLEIWMSGRSIRVGERWSSDLLRQLDQASFGIICVTGDNIDSAWINFEAGALAKSVGSQTYVAPYLIDIKKKELRGPLKQFQAARATKKGTWKLVRSLALAANPRRKSFESLEQRFEEHWPELKDRIRKVRRSAD